MRRLPPSRVRGQRVVDLWSDACGSGETQRSVSPPSAESIVDGEGILDVVKNITKRTGRKAVNKLAEKVGRKIGKEVASSVGLRPERSVVKKNESAGDRIREILEANSLTRRGRPSGPRDVDRRWTKGPSEASERSDQTKPAQWPGRAPGKSLNQAHGTDSQRRRAATQKVNEAVSKLLADDD